MFERKTTVKLDQDKGKFLSKNAAQDSKTVVNPYAAQTEKKLNPFELKI